MTQSNTFTQFSIVFTAKSNNPTILNPDFLKFNNIVGEEWELKTPPLCAEPLSQVLYKNNVGITSQLDKIIFFKNDTQLDKDAFKIIYDIAKGYLNLVPLVNYTGVGINTNSFIEISEDTKAHQYLIDNFLNIKIKESGISIENLGFKFSVPVGNDVVCNIEFSPMKTVQEEKEIHKIIISSNFHHPVNMAIDKKIQSMKDIIDGYQNIVQKLENDILPFFIGGE